jgi:hypothetical protein
MPLELDRPVVALSSKDVLPAEASIGARLGRLHLKLAAA